jgi:hypothetical protein
MEKTTDKSKILRGLSTVTATVYPATAQWFVLSREIVPLIRNLSGFQAKCDHFVSTLKYAFDGKRPVRKQQIITWQTI